MVQDSQSWATDIDGAIQLARGHSWMALAAAISWILVRISKDDRAVKWFPLELAPRWRAWGAAIIGLVYGILHKLAAGGGTWGEAIVGGLVAGNAATLGHELLIESLRKGRDLGMSKEDAPPPPPPKPPLSIKPPANVTITGALLMLVLSCVHNPVVEESAPLALNAAECKRKALALVADGGTCAEKRDRLVELVATDPDCVGLYADAGPMLVCRAKDGGSDER